MITIPGMDEKKKITLIVIVAVFLIYVDCIALFRLQTKILSGVNVKLAKSRKDLAELDKTLALMKESEKAGEKRKTKRVISEEEISSLLNEVENTAGKNNVRITQIKAAKESEEKKGKVEAKAEDKGAKYKLVSLDLSCGYHDFGKFLNELENMEVFVSVAEMKIKANPKNMLKQDVNLTLKVYVKE